MDDNYDFTPEELAEARGKGRDEIIEPTEFKPLVAQSKREENGKSPKRIPLGLGLGLRLLFGLAGLVCALVAPSVPCASALRLRLRRPLGNSP